MRRIFNGLLVLSFVLSLTATPAYAAPRRDNGDGYLTPLKKIEKILEKINRKTIKKNDTGDMSVPRP